MSNSISPGNRSVAIIHRDLISFLNESRFDILHADRTDSRVGLLRKIKSGMATKEEIKHQKYFIDYLVESSFINTEGLSDWDILELQDPAILHALIMFTNRCNMDCRYCYTESNLHLGEEKELSGKQWINLFESIRLPGNLKLQNISLTGGEPTIHPCFSDVMRWLSGKYKVEISSNGLKVNNGLIKILKEFEGLQNFNISIDSFRSEEDEVMRGEGTYDPRIRNIEKLHKEGVPLCLGIVVNGITVNSLKETTNYFLTEFPNLKIKYIPISKMGKALSLEDSLFLSRDDAKEYIDIVVEMRRKWGRRVLTDPTSTSRDLIAYGMHWSGRCSHMKFESERDLNLMQIDETETIMVPEKCNAAYGIVSISPSGRMRPCLRADSFYGDLFNEEFKEILMPSIIGLSFKDIGNLPFWDYVKKEAYAFNPHLTCALKNVLGDKNESQKCRTY